MKKFLNDESGAVTVDWVVMTAGVVALGIAVLIAVGGGTETLSDKTSVEMNSIEVGNNF